MQQLLTALKILHDVAHSAHLNVSGPQFFSWHTIYHDLYEYAHDAYDSVAEMIRAHGTLVRLSHSAIDDFVASQDEFDIATEVLKKIKIVCDQIEDIYGEPDKTLANDIRMKLSKFQYLISAQMV